MNHTPATDSKGREIDERADYAVIYTPGARSTARAVALCSGASALSMVQHSDAPATLSFVLLNDGRGE